MNTAITMKLRLFVTTHTVWLLRNPSTELS